MFDFLSKLYYGLAKSAGLDATASFNPFALRKAKIVYSFGLSECIRVNSCILTPFINSETGFFAAVTLIT